MSGFDPPRPALILAVELPTPPKPGWAGRSREEGGPLGWSERSGRLSGFDATLILARQPVCGLG